VTFDAWLAEVREPWTRDALIAQLIAGVVGLAADCASGGVDGVEVYIRDAGVDGGEDVVKVTGGDLLRAHRAPRRR